MDPKRAEPDRFKLWRLWPLLLLTPLAYDLLGSWTRGIWATGLRGSYWVTIYDLSLCAVVVVAGYLILRGRLPREWRHRFSLWNLLAFVTLSCVGFGFWTLNPRGGMWQALLGAVLIFAIALCLWRAWLALRELLHLRQ
jgi:hypothetical protein